jgi:hypothetical protein
MIRLIKGFLFIKKQLTIILLIIFHFVLALRFIIIPFNYFYLGFGLQNKITFQMILNTQRIDILNIFQAIKFNFVVLKRVFIAHAYLS